MKEERKKEGSKKISPQEHETLENEKKRKLIQKHLPLRNHLAGRRRAVSKCAVNKGGKPSKGTSFGKENNFYVRTQC